MLKLSMLNVTLIRVVLYIILVTVAYHMYAQYSALKCCRAHFALCTNIPTLTDPSPFNPVTDRTNVSTIDQVSEVTRRVKQHCHHISGRAPCMRASDSVR